MPAVKDIRMYLTLYHIFLEEQFDIHGLSTVNGICILILLLWDYSFVLLLF